MEKYNKKFNRKVVSLCLRLPVLCAVVPVTKPYLIPALNAVTAYVMSAVPYLKDTVSNVSIP